MRPRVLVPALLMLVAYGLNCAPARAQTYLVSQSSSGQLANTYSASSSISADGRYVAFSSAASNLVAGDTNGVYDVFVHDRQTGITTRVSVGAAGLPANGDSYSPSISADGRYVAFWSGASNLVTGDTNGWGDVFVHDRQAGVTTRVSVGAAGEQANRESQTPRISSDGRYVAFSSRASNLVTGDTNPWSDIFVYDRQTGVTTRVNVGVAGAQASWGHSYNPSISADGRYVAFHSNASNLVAEDTNNQWDVFVHDRQIGVTTRVSVRAAGVQANDSSYNPSISADGRYVAFQSSASNLVAAAGDTNRVSDVFVHDRQTGVSTRVSVGAAGTQSNNDSGVASISGGGRHVAFFSYARNLVLGDTNLVGDIFVHDRQTGVTTRVSVDAGGAEDFGHSYSPSISDDGRYVVFESEASNLVPGDTNRERDIFVRDTRPCLGDADDDRTVNFTDITGVLSNFGDAYPRSTGVGDATLDGLVNFLDITTVLANWGTTCD